MKFAFFYKLNIKIAIFFGIILIAIMKGGSFMTFGIIIAILIIIFLAVRYQKINAKSIQEVIQSFNVYIRLGIFIGIIGIILYVLGLIFGYEEGSQLGRLFFLGAYIAYVVALLCLLSRFIKWLFNLFFGKAG